MRMRSKHKLALLLPVLAVTLVALASLKLATNPDIATRLLSLIVGINGNQISATSMRDVRYLQPDMVRLDGFPWDIIEAKKGVFDFSVSDRAMRWARTSQQQVLGIIQYAPSWANGQNFETPKNLRISNCGIPDLSASDTRYNALRTYPPKQSSDFGVATHEIANKYPDVDYWQIWNEPNNPIFWPTGPSASGYARLLKTAHINIKKANPNAHVVLGGISLNDLTYIRGLYIAGAKNYFDVMAVHLYNPAQAPSEYLEHELEKLHELMVKYGDGNKPIWLTEIGWYTGGARNAVNEQEQSEYLQQVVSIAQSKSYVRAVFWNTLMDCSDAYDATNLEHNYGIFDDASPKPAAHVMRGILLSKKQ